MHFFRTACSSYSEGELDGSAQVWLVDLAQLTITEDDKTFDDNYEAEHSNQIKSQRGHHAITDADSSEVCTLSNNSSAL